MKKTIFEEIGGTYIRHGDYLIPCLTLPEEKQRFVGVLFGKLNAAFSVRLKQVFCGV